MGIVQKLRTVHQDASWTVGYLRGQSGMPFGKPWWADKVVYGSAYLHGKGIELSPSEDIEGKSLRVQEVNSFLP